MLRANVTGRLAFMAGIVAVLSFLAVADGGWTLFVQRAIDGLHDGFIFAAIALAMALIYKATGVLNLAQGEMAMLGAFIAYVFVHDHRFPLAFAILLAMALSALGAGVVERVLIRRFDPRNHLGVTIVTLGLFLGINGAAAVVWGVDNHAFPSLFPEGADDQIVIWGARLRYAVLGVWVVVLATVALVALLLRRTKIGLAFRAVSSNLDSSELIGIDVGRTLQFGWALAAAVGTLAACLIAPTTLLEPNFMIRVLIFAVAAVTLGGLDSIGGAVVGGILVGLLRTMLSGYVDQIGSQLSEVVALGLIVAVLVARPSGLFGTRQVARV